MDKKKKKKSKKDKGDAMEEGEQSLSLMDTSMPSNGALLADVQHAKSFILASSSMPSKMQASEWPLLLKVTFLSPSLTSS